MTHPKKKKSIYLALFLCLITIALSAGGYFFYQKNEQQRLINEQIAKQKEEKRIADKKALDALFTKYTDNFKQEIRKNVQEYAQSKKLIQQIISPYNYENTEFAKENYTLFMDTIAPNMRKKSGDIINLFQTYQEQIKKDLEKHNTEDQKEFLVRWKAMSDEMLNLYISYFTNEEDYIAAHETLIKFYYTYSKRYTVDIENNVFLFDSDKDAKKHMELKNAIKSIKKKGLETLKKEAQ